MMEEFDRKVISEYRDKIRVQRFRILIDYAEETVDRGRMLYIYNHNATYQLCVCEEGRSHEVINLDESELPDGANVGSVLRDNDGMYVIDTEATEVVSERIYELIKRLLDEQDEYLSSLRVEGHVYEVSEKGLDRLWLFDVTEDNGEEIEEIDISGDVLERVQEGDLIRFEDGEYKLELG